MSWDRQTLSVLNRWVKRTEGTFQNKNFRQVHSLILSGKNILQELLSRELTTMRHVSFIQNLDNLEAYLYSDRQSSNFLTIEIQSNLKNRFHLTVEAW